MINIKEIIFRRRQDFDDISAAVWFGAAVPFIMAISATISYAASWLNIESLDWLFISVGGAIFVVIAAGGWLFPLIGVVLAIRGFKNNRGIAKAAIVLSASELAFYLVVIGSIFINSNTIID